MMRGLGRLLGVHYLDRIEIMQIARRHSDEMGWPWDEPIVVHEGMLSTSVHTNADHKGGNVYIRINARTGRIAHAFFSRR